jgi:3D (Asp-Asp-Asp) domain-containing protein
VEDTGRAIRGRRLDVYIANHAEAKRFGRRRLSVEIPTRTAAALR